MNGIQLAGSFKGFVGENVGGKGKLENKKVEIRAGILVAKIINFVRFKNLKRSWIKWSQK